MKVKLGVVKSRAEAANAPKTLEVLGQLEDEVGMAIESVSFAAAASSSSRRPQMATAASD